MSSTASVCGELNGLSVLHHHVDEALNSVTLNLTLHSLHFENSPYDWLTKEPNSSCLGNSRILFDPTTSSTESELVELDGVQCLLSTNKFASHDIELREMNCSDPVSTCYHGHTLEYKSPDLNISNVISDIVVPSSSSYLCLRYLRTISYTNPGWSWNPIVIHDTNSFKLEEECGDTLEEATRWTSYRSHISSTHFYVHIPPTIKVSEEEKKVDYTYECGHHTGEYEEVMKDTSYLTLCTEISSTPSLSVEIEHLHVQYQYLHSVGYKERCVPTMRLSRDTVFLISISVVMGLVTIGCILLLVYVIVRK